METRASLCVVRVEERSHPQKKRNTMPSDKPLPSVDATAVVRQCTSRKRVDVRGNFGDAAMSTVAAVYIIFLTTYITIYPLMHQWRARIWENYVHADMRYVRPRITGEIGTFKKKWLTPISSEPAEKPSGS